MRDPLDTATEYHRMHPSHPAEPRRGDLYVGLLCAAGYLTLIFAVLYLALES